MRYSGPPRIPVLRLGAAILLSPLPIALLLGVAAGFVVEPQDALRYSLTVAAAGAVLGTGGALVVGLPLALWLLRDPAASWTSWGLAGLGSGAILTAPLLLVWGLAMSSEPFSFYWLLPFAIVLSLASASSLVARLILLNLPGAR